MEASRDRVIAEVGSWEGVAVAPHRFGGTEFRLGGREIGHIHTEGIADLPFTRRVRDMLIETGRAHVHRILPNSGWVERRLATDDDATEVIELFRLSYERAQVANAVRATREAERPG